MSRLSDLTLVVPTYERQRNVMTLMKYWSGKIPKILIMDGSSRPLNPDVLKFYDENIEYHHMMVSHGERIKKAFPFIKTKYAMLLCDDEFYLPSGLDELIAQLNADDELVACQGRCLGFRSGVEVVLAKQMYREMKDYKIDDDSPAERMIYHMGYYCCSTFYAMMPSEVWKKSMSVLDEGFFSCSYAGELRAELATCYQGKSKVIDELVWLRNMDNPPISIDGFNRRLQLPQWFNDIKYNKQVILFYDSLTKHLSSFDGASKEKVRNDIVNAVDAYFNYCAWRRFFFLYYGFYERTMNRFSPLERVALSMIRKGVFVDLDDLEDISKLIVSSARAEVMMNELNEEI